MSEARTLAQELTESEKDQLDIQKWYVVVKQLSDRDITLFFQRIADVIRKRVSPGCTLENLVEIQQTLKGITFVESQLKRIKKEQLIA